MLGVICGVILYSVFAKTQKEDDMSARIAVTRTDHTTENLRALASRHKYRDCRVRLRAIALMIGDDLPRSEISRSVGVDVQTLRDWAIRYNARGLDGLRDAARSGRPRKLDESQTAEPVSLIEGGSDPDAGEPSRWTLGMLQQWIDDRFEVDLTVEGVRQMLRRLGFRHLSPRPIHPKANPEAQECFRHNFSQLVQETLPGNVPGEDVLLYFQDEARIGQKGMLSRIWARKGTRPRIPRDYRYGYVCLFSAACPETGHAVGHVCDKANAREMNRHLRDVGKELPEGKHAVMILDGAGWHRSKDPEIPPNVSLLRLPPYSPELNPIETLFAVLKHGHFANRVFESAEHVRETVIQVWNTFTRKTDEIMRITRRDWAQL